MSEWSTYGERERGKCDVDRSQCSNVNAKRHQFKCVCVCIFRCTINWFNHGMNNYKPYCSFLHSIFFILFFSLFCSRASSIKHDGIPNLLSKLFWCKHHSKKKKEKLWAPFKLLLISVYLLICILHSFLSSKLYCFSYLITSLVNSCFIRTIRTDDMCTSKDQCQK